MDTTNPTLPMTSFGTSKPAAPARLTARTSTQPTVFLPVLLLALAFVTWLAFQALQHVAEHRQLGAALAGLEAQQRAATRLRTSLDAMALATAKLASQGNPNARVIVEELRKRGVTINASAGAASSLPTAP